jgi:hypothetical protein
MKKNNNKHGQNIQIIKQDQSKEQEFPLRMGYIFLLQLQARMSKRKRFTGKPGSTPRQQLLEFK